MCEVESWIPNVVAATLFDGRATEPVVAWLTAIRDTTEEYDPLVIVRPPSPIGSESPDSAFDEILSHLGKEIYKLDEYQNNLVPEEKEVSLSILNIFDECLDQMTDKKPPGSNMESDNLPVQNGWATFSDSEEYPSELECKSVQEVIGNGFRDFSDCENDSFVTSTPAVRVSDKRTKLSASTSSSIYDNLDIGDESVEWTKLIESDSDESESTCWSYKECSDGDGEPDVNNAYASMWIHSSGFHHSDEILRHVLSKNQATVSRLSFDTASEFTPPEYSVYALQEVGDRCGPPVEAMTPDRPEDVYEPVKDAITDENIYEEIEFNHSYTDEGCSCGTSVEVESCSISASSDGVGRDSPLYANLRDHDAYAVTPDVIFWKNLLLDPYYNDDEEDEWITPEECAVYAREQRPPLVIPRITPYRAPRQRLPMHYTEDSLTSMRNYDRLENWSPTSEKTRAELERSFSKPADSQPFAKPLDKRLGGSTENLLLPRRPHHIQLPATSSGDSLDVEIRGEHAAGRVRGRQVRSFVHRLHSPVPAPRTIVPLHEAQALLEGTVKRTKFFEGGKKSKKNWTDGFMILTATALYIYKDLKTFYKKSDRAPGTPPSPTAPQAELVLPLRNATVQLCKPMHTRRHTRSLVLTWDRDQYLVQYETEETARRWFTAIQSIINRQYPLMPSESPHYQSSNTDLESLGRTPPASRHQTRNKRAGGSSNEDLSDSTEVSKSHVRSRLRKFFAKRPAMEVLVKKGIYKDEPVFGRNLEEVCTPGVIPRVPEFVVACVTEIERDEENMTTDGLYRASGNLSQVQKIRLEIDQNNMGVIKNNTDIHVLTGSLKLFFRELKKPLIPCNMFDRVLAACSIKPKEAKIKEFREIIQSLPDCNRDTLKYLLEHLLRVTQYSDRNRMHTANLAIVFGPTLLWAPEEQAHNIAVDCIQQNNVVDILLNEFHNIFVEEDSKGKKKA